MVRAGVVAGPELTYSRTRRAGAVAGRAEERKELARADRHGRAERVEVARQVAVVEDVVVETLPHATDLDRTEVPVGRNRQRVVVQRRTANLLSPLIRDTGLERAIGIEAAERTDIRM